MPITQNAKKLRMHTCQSGLLLNKPEDYLQIIGGLPENFHISTESVGKFPFVHLFVQDQLEFQTYLQKAVGAIQYDGILWISYPKKSSTTKSDLNRDILWELMDSTNLRPVQMVSLTETWSAMRFRPGELVGKG